MVEWLALLTAYQEVLCLNWVGGRIQLMIVWHFIAQRPIHYRPSLVWIWGWLGETKVLYILHHWGIQLILAYSLAITAILAAGKGRGGMFLFLLFLRFHSFSSFSPVPLFHLLYYLFCLASPFLWETIQNDPPGLTCQYTPTESISNMEK